MPREWSRRSTLGKGISTCVFLQRQREDPIKAWRIKQAATRDEGEMVRRAVGKKMLGLAGLTAGAAGRAEVLRGEVWGVGVCRSSDGREG